MTGTLKAVIPDDPRVLPYLLASDGVNEVRIPVSRAKLWGISAKLETLIKQIDGDLLRLAREARASA